MADGYDPVVMEKLQRHYNLQCRYTDTYEELLEQAETVVIATVWPQFADVKTKTNSPVVDCRYMLG